MNDRVRLLLGTILLLGMVASAQHRGASAYAISAPTITTQPASATVKKGASASFTVVASGTAPLKYQWYIASNYPASPITGATSSTYTTAPTTDADNSRAFYVTVSNTAGSRTSSYASLTVVDPVVIYQQPQSMVVTAPAVATFTVYAGCAQNCYPLSYQWYKNGVSIKGATDYSYSTAQSTAADNGAKFTVIVGNSVGKVTSAPAILTVKPYAGTGTYPIVGEWSGTATITSPGGAKVISQVVAGFWQTSYSLSATFVFVDENGIAQMGAGMASLNNLNLFTVEEDSNLAAAFSPNLLQLTGGALAYDGEGGNGTLLLSSDHTKLTGSGSTSDGTKLSWTLTRIK